MNDIVACGIASFAWGFVVWLSGGLIKDIMEDRLIKFSGIGFFIQIIGCAFMVVPFVVAIIGISAFLITSFTTAISAFI